jgi:hypothetical protein
VIHLGLKLTLLCEDLGSHRLVHGIEHLLTRLFFPALTLAPLFVFLLPFLLFGVAGGDGVNDRANTPVGHPSLHHSELGPWRFVLLTALLHLL